jgi:hypothetical protein
VDAERQLNDIIAIGGSLAESAAFLFEQLPADGEALSLDGPIDINTENLPLWLRKGAEALGIDDIPKLRLRLERNDTGVLVAVAKVSGTFEVETGGAKNEVVYEIDLDQADADERKLSVSTAIENFEAPTGWEWLDLDDVELNIDYKDTNPGDHQFNGRFETDITIAGATPRLKITVADDPATTTLVATLDGSVPIAGLLELVGRSPDADSDDLVDLFGLADATVEEIELSIDATTDPGDGPVLGVFGRLGGVFDDVRVRFVLGLDGSALAPTYLAGLVVDDPPPDGDAAHCDCITLARILPVTAGTLAADLELPAVRFLQTVSNPQGGTFDTTRLGDRARALVSEIDPSIAGPDDENGDDNDGEVQTQTQSLMPMSADASDGVLVATNSLEMSLDVPLGGLAPFFEALGIEVPDTLGLRGSLGFSLPDLVNDPTGGEISSFELEATLAELGSTTSDFADWLAFPSTGEWRFRLAYDAGDDDTPRALTVGVSIEGITFDGIEVLGDVVLGLSASFETVGDDGWKIVLRGELGEAWVEPFGISWLTVNELFVEVTIESDGSDEPQLSARVRGAVTIGSGSTEVSLAVEIALDGDGVTFLIELTDALSVGQMVDGLFSGSGIALPEFLRSVAIDSGKIEVRVAGGRVDVTGAGAISFQLYERDAEFGRDPISVSFLAAAGFDIDETSLDYVTFGVKPGPGLTLKRVLPPDIAEELLPIDFPVISAQPSAEELATTGFAFVFSALPPSGSLSIADLTDGAQEWFGPLFGGTDQLTARRIDRTFTALGSFGLPEPFDALAETLGFEPRVLASGSLPLPGLDGDISLDLRLSLQVNQAVLAYVDFVDSLEVAIELGIGEDGAELGLRLDGILRFLQGLDPDLTDTAEELVDALTGGITPIDFSAFDAEQITAADPATHTCPRGGVPGPRPAPPQLGAVPAAVDLTDAPWYCYDLIEASVYGKLVVTTAPSIGVRLGGDLTSLATIGNDDLEAGWAPLGIDPIIIRQLAGYIEVGVTTDPVTPVSLKVGALANGTAKFADLDRKPFAGAFQIGVKLGVTSSTPPVPVIRPNVEELGLMLSLPGGLATSELVGLYDTVATAITPAGQEPPVLGPLANELPDIGVRDLYFSFAPTGVSALCIEQGIILQGDLYLYTGPELPEVKPVDTCNLRTGEAPTPTENRCLERKDEGCVAGMLFSLTPSGIIAEGVVAGFDLAPLPIALTDDVEVVVRLTTEQQLVRVAGGVRFGPEEQPWAEGRLAFEARPLSMDFAGLVDIYGFRVLVNGRASADLDKLLELISGGEGPGLELHVVLAAPELADPRFASGTGADFNAVVAELITPALVQLELIVSEIDDVIDDLGRDPIGTILGLPARLQQAGIAVPGGIVDGASELQKGLADFEAARDSAWSDVFDWVVAPAIDASLDMVLNGYRFDGIESFQYPEQRTCVKRGLFGEPLFEYDLTKPFDPLGDPPNPGLSKGTVVNGVCWTIVDAWLGTWVNPVCMGLAVDGGCYLVPPFGWDGICSDVFPGRTSCPPSVVRAEIRNLIAEAAADVIGTLDGLQPPNMTQVLNAIRSFVVSDQGTLFELPCAEFRASASLLGGASATVALDATVVGQQLEFGSQWSFSLQGLLDSVDFAGSVDDMLAAFWSYLTNPGDPITCEGAPEDVFGPDGIDFGPQLVHLRDPDAAPPPPRVVVEVAPARIFENGVVTATVGFDRALTDDDGARTVEIDWGRDEGTNTVTIQPPNRTATATHRYLDDDPSGTPADRYRITARDVTQNVGSPTSAWTTVLVRNVAPTVGPLQLSTTEIDEGGRVTLTVPWTDPGTRDTHSVTVAWGDGTVTRVGSVADGAVSPVVLTHTYVDDDPSGTAVDTYTIEVTVTDDDLGVGAASIDVDVANVPPTLGSNAVSPSVVDEGTPVVFRVDFDDVGVRDWHVVEVDVTGDGTFDVRRVVPSGRRSTSFVWEFRDDDPTHTPEDPLELTVRVVDDDMIELDGSGGPAIDEDGQVVLLAGQEWFETTQTITVRNVAPELCATLAPGGFPGPNLDDEFAVDECPDVEEIVVVEGDVATIEGAFSDPGVDDDHVVVVDWGHAGLTPIVLGDPGLVRLPAEFAGDLSFPFTVVDGAFSAEGSESFERGSRRFSIDRAFMDNGLFTVRVWVIDDDTGVAHAALPVLVLNADPTADIDTGTGPYPRTVEGTTVVLADGPDDDGVLDTDTFLTRSGVESRLRATASDPGSDDLTFTWTWDLAERFGDGTTSTTYLADPERDPDPLPSPDGSARVDVVDVQSHAWAQACLYEVGLEVVDDDFGWVGRWQGGLGTLVDDTGRATDSTWVVVTGTDRRVRGAGWWDGQFDFSKNRNRTDLSEVTLGCYLDITRHMSQVFDLARSTATFEEARQVLLRPSMDDDDDKLDRQILATWLNLSHGSLGWFDVVTTPEGAMLLLDALRRAEAVFLDPDAPRPVQIAWKDALEGINR